MDTKRFSKIKTLNDLKLEKARLRYELLMIENKLAEDLSSLEKLASISSFISYVNNGFEFAYRIYERIHEIISRFRSSSSEKKKKKKKKGSGNEE